MSAQCGSTEARAAIEAANAKFSEAFAQGDAKALSAMYTPDAIAFPPDSEIDVAYEVGNVSLTIQAARFAADLAPARGQR